MRKLLFTFMVVAALLGTGGTALASPSNSNHYYSVAKLHLGSHAVCGNE